MAIGTLPPVIGEVPVSTGQPGRQPLRPERGGVPHPGADAGTHPATATATLPDMSVLDAAVADALGRQDGLAPVFAAATVLRGDPDLPPLLARALDALMDLVVTADVGPDDLRAAVAASGLFHESQLSDGLPAGDLKAILRMVAAMLAGMGGPMNPEAEPDPGRRHAPPPPRRGFRPAGQPAVPLPDLPPADLPGHLAEAADRALARILLHQAASIADPDDARIRPAAEAAPGLHLEIPVAGPTGIGIAAVRIDRDPPDRSRRGPDDPPAGPVFRVEVAFALDPLGSVTARVGLLPGRRVVVGLWCASEAAADRIEQETGTLKTVLESVGLDVGGVDLHVGPPPEPRPPTAHPPPHRLDVSL